VRPHRHDAHGPRLGAGQEFTQEPLAETERIDVARGGASASTGRIDGCVALAMALQMITMAPKRESVYHSRGRISLSG
jgi:hypothetical protein